MLTLFIFTLGAYYEDAGFAWNYWNTLEDVPIYSAINMSGDRVGKIYKVGSRKSQVRFVESFKFTKQPPLPPTIKC